MHDKEIQYFTEGLNLAKDEFYLDSINKFQMLIDEYPQSDLADDALYNIGLCYFKMKQFEQAIETFNQVITNYPDATISALDNGNEFGLTTAKCLLGIFNCYFLSGETENAKKIIGELKPYDNTSYLMVNNNKTTFKEMAENTLKIRKK